MCNIGDVGGQKSLRSYWQNYFEKTDTLIWVVDAADRDRIADCRRELLSLLLEEVCRYIKSEGKLACAYGKQRLMGASLLILVNKTDIPDCMSDADVQRVRSGLLVLGAFN